MSSLEKQIELGKRILVIDENFGQKEIIFNKDKITLSLVQYHPRRTWEKSITIYQYLCKKLKKECENLCKLLKQTGDVKVSSNTLS